MNACLPIYWDDDDDDDDDDEDVDDDDDDDDEDDDDEDDDVADAYADVLITLKPNLGIGNFAYFYLGSLRK